MIIDETNDVPPVELPRQAPNADPKILSTLPPSTQAKYRAEFVPTFDAVAPKGEAAGQATYHQLFGEDRLAYVAGKLAVLLHQPGAIEATTNGTFTVANLPCWYLLSEAAAQLHYRYEAEFRQRRAALLEERRQAQEEDRQSAYEIAEKQRRKEYEARLANSWTFIGESAIVARGALVLATVPNINAMSNRELMEQLARMTILEQHRFASLPEDQRQREPMPEHVRIALNVPPYTAAPLSDPDYPVTDSEVN
jgi:hypothetical protein